MFYIGVKLLKAAAMCFLLFFVVGFLWYVNEDHPRWMIGVCSLLLILSVCLGASGFIMTARGF